MNISKRKKNSLANNLCIIIMYELCFINDFRFINEFRGRRMKREEGWEKKKLKMFDFLFLLNS